MKNKYVILKVKDKQGNWINAPLVAGTPSDTPIINHGTGDTTFALTPNEYHVWGEVSELTITLAAPTDANIINEYMFQFTSGIQPTKLTYPQEVKWVAEPKIEASKTYQVSIVNGIGVLGGV